MRYDTVGQSSRWGRRRPFVFAASIMICCCLLSLGFSQEIVGLVTSDLEAGKPLVIVIAMLALYVMDFATDVGMAMPIHNLGYQD